MRDEISSKSLGASSELLVISDLKQDFIPIRDSITYATRLRILLRALNSIRKIGLEEKGETIYVGPIDRLQTIHTVRWTVIEENRKMLLAVTFDRSLETYVRRIVDIAGPVLDAILCHCSGYKDHTCWQGHEGFSRYVAKNQIDVDFYGASSPHLTVDDIVYLTKLEQKQRSMTDLCKFDEFAAKLNLPSQSDNVREALKNKPEEAKQQALDLISAMYRLKDYFPYARKGQSHIGSDQFYLQRLTEALVFEFKPSSLTTAEYDQYQKEIDWFSSFETNLSSILTEEAPVAPDPRDVQGGILNSYGATDTGYLMLLQFSDEKKAKAFLKNRKKELTTAGELVDKKVYCNFSLTYRGLKALGLNEPVLRQFPKEFREGMEARAGKLGDMGRNYPKNWRLPRHPVTGHEVKMSSVDMVVQLQGYASPKGKKAASLHRKLEGWKKAAEKAGVDILAIEQMQRTKAPDGSGFVEHFGFLDGVSQPHVKGVGASKPKARNDRDAILLGDVFMGYQSERDVPKTVKFPDEVEMEPLLKDGTFLVVRKLKQNVKSFNDFVNGSKNTIGRRALEAKMMGRYPNGTPLLPDHVSLGKNINDFDYQDDPDGVVCPMHSHIRRTNPREMSKPKAEGPPTPRIIRRGFSYGSRYSHETAHEERGLFFMAYNASIAEQFEVIQRWINGGNSTGVMSKHFDAIMAARHDEEDRTIRFMHDNQVHRIELPKEQFVDLEWGLYLFVPSLDAIDRLCGSEDALPQISDGRLAGGAKSIFQLQSMERELTALGYPEPVVQERMRYAWKALLEDPSGEDLADEVWAKIRHDGGVLQTPYGVLVGNLANVKAVFKDDGSTYSTREYWERMRNSIGELYLGLDPKPAIMPSGSVSENPMRDKAFEKETKKSDYSKIAKPTNGWIASITEEKAFDLAVCVTRNWFRDELVKRRDPHSLELKECIVDLLGGLSKIWFDLPEDGSIDIGGEACSRPNVPDDLVSASHYLFGPRPTDFVVDEAKERGTSLKKAIRAFVEEQAPTPDTLHHFLSVHPVFKGDLDLITRTLVGCVNGFVAASRGSFLSIMQRWMANEDLWRYRQMLLSAVGSSKNGALDYATAKSVFREEMIIAMQKRSRPNLLHRVAVKQAILGGVEIQAGQAVVLSLQSAAEEQEGNPEILFGGNYRDTVHACSGQQMAIGVLMGVISVVMEQDVLEYQSTFSLSLSKE
ncbi:Dyp-type peroxidase [Sneathiella aquimaris]|uniref:Dyp-type peroxidase n=1 Tax=Sneathiella aquimaris TaxID=2599305 RepID=UPI00146CB86B|nr:Dyp-type peroxidase domain-containing protein [Sneathiella aquimaris]